MSIPLTAPAAKMTIKDYGNRILKSIKWMALIQQLMPLATGRQPNLPKIIADVATPQTIDDVFAIIDLAITEAETKYQKSFLLVIDKLGPGELVIHIFDKADNKAPFKTFNTKDITADSIAAFIASTQK